MRSANDARLLLAGYSSGIEARAAFEPVDLRLEPAEVVLVRGENGAGKSTLLRGIAGLCQVEQGQILLDGADLRGASARCRIRAGIAYVPQFGGLFETLSVTENARLSELVKARPDRTEITSLGAAGLGIDPDRRVGGLSGGERRLLASQRALATEPALLLLDEPLAGVAAAMRELIIERVFGAIDQSGCSVLWAEHDPGQLGPRFARTINVIPAI